jgi:TnpA family transposase
MSNDGMVLWSHSDRFRRFGRRRQSSNRRIEDEALRAGVSIVDRLVVPSTLLTKLTASPKTNTLSRALR